MNSADSWLEALAAELGPEARLLRQAETAAFSQDCAGFETLQPAAVLLSSAPAECAAAIAFAARKDINVSLRGAGLSCNGQTLTRDLVIALEAPVGAIASPSAGRLALHGGCRWLDVVRHLAGSGWGLPVLTSYLRATVGGTLANGGFGARSIQHGCQIDHVDRVHLLTPDGIVHDLKPTHSLFGSALGSQGQAGLIVGVTIGLAKDQVASAVFRKAWTSHDAMFDDIRRLADLSSHERPDGFFVFIDEGQLHGRPLYGVYGIDSGSGRASSRVPAGAQHVRETSHFDLDLHDDVTAWVKALGDQHFMFSDFVFDIDGFTQFTKEILAGPIPAFLTAAYILAAAEAPRDRPRFECDPRQGRDGLSLGLGLYCAVPRGQPTGPALAFLASATERCLALGGRPLLYGAHAYATRLQACVNDGALAKLAAVPGARRGFNRAWLNRHSGVKPTGFTGDG